MREDLHLSVQVFVFLVSAMYVEWQICMVTMYIVCRGKYRLKNGVDSLEQVVGKVFAEFGFYLITNGQHYVC